MDVNELICMVIEGTDVIEAIDLAAGSSDAPGLAEQGKWIQKAIKEPDTLRRQLRAPERQGPKGGKIEEPIPAEKLSKEKAKLQKKAAGKKVLPKPELTKLRRIVLAQTLRKLPKRGSK